MDSRLIVATRRAIAATVGAEGLEPPAPSL